MQLIRSAGITAADSQLKAYVNWVHHVQQDSDPNGIDVRGEPKVSHSSCISLHVLAALPFSRHLSVFS